MKIYDGDSLTEKRFKEFTPSELSSLYDRYMKETRPNSYEKEEDVYFSAQSNNSNRGKFNGNNSRSAPKSDGNGKNEGKDTKGDKNKANKKKVKRQNCGKMGHSANKCYSNKQTHFVQSELEDDSSDEYNFNIIAEHAEHADAKAGFILDSGSTIHVVKNQAMLRDIRPYKSKLRTIGGTNLADVSGDCYVNNKLTLKDAIVAENAPYNIISTTRLNKKGYDVQMKNNGKTTIYKNSKVVATAIEKNHLLFLNTRDIKEHLVFNISEDNYGEAVELHKNNGHAKVQQLKKLLKHEKIHMNLNEIKSIIKECTICNQGYMQKSHGTSRINKKGMKFGQILVTDVFGPVHGKYGLLVSDMVSKFTIGKVLNSRRETSFKTIEILRQFNSLLNLTNNKICFLRSDNEFQTKALSSYCNKKGITQQFTAPHSSFQNGAAENMNMQVKRKIKLLFESGLSKFYWTFAFNHALFLLNNLPLHNDDISPWAKISNQTKQMLPMLCLQL